MTRDHWKKVLPYVIAFADGKDVQGIDGRGGWAALEDPEFSGKPENYRIKPEPRVAWFNPKTLSGYSPEVYDALEDSPFKQSLVKFVEEV